MDLDAATYARMRWNTPLSEEHASLLLRRLDVTADDRLLDVGCGWGELLLRAVAAAPDATVTGVGVDTDERLLERGRALAEERGLGDRVRFVHGEAAQWREPADRVLCVGSTHAFGGPDATLEALRDLVAPGGRVLVGDGCWEAPPSSGVAELFEEVLPLRELLGHARRLGWRLLHLSTADQREWDDFESTWRAGREEWLLAHPGDPRAPELRSRLDASVEDYVTGYRGVLGFCYLVLARDES